MEDYELDMIEGEEDLVDYYKQRVVMLDNGLITEDRVGGMFNEEV